MAILFRSITWPTDDCFLILMTQDEHYTMQDAASLSITIMKKMLRGRVFLGCDNHPLSRLPYKEFLVHLFILNYLDATTSVARSMILFLAYPECLYGADRKLWIM